MPNHVESKTGSATRERCLRAAETLFLEHGFDGTSLRMVTAKAKVNLAAVNYHFGGKDGLFLEMIARRLDLMNEARVARLDELERRAKGKPLACERILGALFMPALELARDAKRGGRNFLRLLGRAYVDPSPVLRGFLSDRYAPMVARFKDAFGRALPKLAKQELSWRLHFLLGALAYTLAGTDAWKLIAQINPQPDDDVLLLRRLAPFLIAGLQAPIPDLAQPGSYETDDPIAPRAQRAASTDRTPRSPGARSRHTRRPDGARAS
jgi:AcrR family transcriptional regulator